MRYLVIAACEDARSGAEFKSGDEFLPEPDADQAERLLRAGCLRRIDDDAPELPIDGRDGPLVTQLRAEIAVLTDRLATEQNARGELLDQTGKALSDLRAERDSIAGELATTQVDRDRLSQEIATTLSTLNQRDARITELEEKLTAPVADTASQAGAAEQPSPPKQGKAKA